MPQSGTANRKTAYHFMKNVEFKRCLNVLGLNVRQILDKALLVDVLDVHGTLFAFNHNFYFMNCGEYFHASSESNF